MLLRHVAHKVMINFLSWSVRHIEGARRAADKGRMNIQSSRIARAIAALLLLLPLASPAMVYLP
ncbi:MAG TPA: hypothetical protein VHE37_00520, partial [Nevskiaceae bacterium]|nr:hypothetical protein [Nevskiaceae bacterium]